jgi:hypothetical protein
MPTQKPKQKIMNAASPCHDHLAELLKRRPELAPLAADIHKAAEMFFEPHPLPPDRRRVFFLLRAPKL